MRATKNKSKIKDYLYQTGALDTNDPVVIEHAKKLYWRNYDNQKKREKRNAKRTYIVSFQNEELSRIKHQVKNYGYTTIPNYIKYVVSNDLANDTIIPNMVIIGQIRQLLSHYKNLIAQIAEKDTKSIFGNKNYDVLEQHITNIERTINVYIYYTPSLKQLIQQQLAKHPDYLHELKTMIANYDRQITDKETVHI